jgi:hypothetical protein
VRERGTQSRRLRDGPPDRGRSAGQQSGGTGNSGSGEPHRSDGPRAWQILAIVAIIAATAGWTAAIMLALRGPGDATPTPPAAVVDPSDSVDVNPSDDVSAPPLVLTHDVPALESLLPTQAGKTPLVSESWTGDEVLADDGFSTTVTKFLTSKGKKPADLQVGQSLDPDGAADILVRLYRVDGVPASDLLTSIIDAWKVDNSDMTVTDTTLAGKPVKKGDFPSAGTVSYWYIAGDHVFDIQSNDPAIAASALEAIVSPGASPAASGSNGASTSPAPSTGASGSPSAVPSAS